MPSPTISIIIPAFNEEKRLPACLQSIVDHRTDDVIEIIVVDNASIDGTADVARSFPGVRVVHEPRKGLTQAREAGRLAARGELFGSLDADTRVNERWFSMIRKTFDTQPSPVALSGPYEYFDLPGWQRLIVRLYWRLLAVPMAWLTGAVMVGGNFVAKSGALAAIGGFDTTIAFFGEDTNIARRLKAVGKVRFDPRFSVLSSGRRLAHDGLIKSGWIYVVSYLSERFFHKQLIKRYTDIR